MTTSCLELHPPTPGRRCFRHTFARRPNPIGLTVLKLVGRDGPKLQVVGVDMLDGTPILDIKPYLSNIQESDLRRGWLGEAEARREKGAE